MDLVVQLPAFVLAVVLISASPGPAVALILRRAVAGSWRAAVPTVLGLELGLVCLGPGGRHRLRRAGSRSETAYVVLRIAGAVVLDGSGSGRGAVRSGDQGVAQADGQRAAEHEQQARARAPG